MTYLVLLKDIWGGVYPEAVCQTKEDLKKYIKENSKNMAYGFYYAHKKIIFIKKFEVKK